jgi:cell division protein ZapA
LLACEIRDGGKVKARERIAVLAALNLAFALAERGDAPSASAGSSADDENATEVKSQTVDITQLIRRLDMALGADGQLL